MASVGIPSKNSNEPSRVDTLSGVMILSGIVVLKFGVCSGTVLLTSPIDRTAGSPATPPRAARERLSGGWQNGRGAILPGNRAPGVPVSHGREHPADPVVGLMSPKARSATIPSPVEWSTR